jgi:hypothetical protein
VGIDAVLGLVRISKDGLEVTLDFEKNGIKEGSARPTAAPPQPATTPSLTPQEVLARLHSQRLLQQRQNPSAANLLPPPPAGRGP